MLKRLPDDTLPDNDLSNPSQGEIMVQPPHPAGS